MVEDVIGQKCILYKINSYNTKTNIYGESVEILDANFSERTIYPNMQKARLIVSTLSSALNEAYGRGKKILFFNYTNKNTLLGTGICSDGRYNSDWGGEVGWFVPTGILLIVVSISGIYMFLFPLMLKNKRTKLKK